MTKLCETSRSNHPPSVSTNQSPQFWQFPPALPARPSQACSGPTPPWARAWLRRSQTETDCKNVNIKYERLVRERELLGVCDDSVGVVVMCDNTELRCPALRETPSCGGRLSGGARVGGRHRVTSRGEHSGNTVSQYCSAHTILL